MDSTIRSLLGKAKHENDKQSLYEAFTKLKGARTNTSDQTDPFHSDLYVICGEVSLEVYNVCNHFMIVCWSVEFKFKLKLLSYNYYLF